MKTETIVIDAIRIDSVYKDTIETNKNKIDKSRKF